MKSVIVCPVCKKLVYFNSYFGAYICDNCSWEDDSYAKKRDSYRVLSKTQTIAKIQCPDRSIALVKARVNKVKKSSAQGKAAVR